MAPQPPAPRKRPTAFVNQLALAMELPFIMIGGVVIGGGLGWLIDRHFHTSPALTLLFGGIGFAAGIWDILKRLNRAENDEEKGNGGG
ncbi:MAG: AtpZ/AtpI family protein [Candidatus Acidiferrales bacterium]